MLASKGKIENPSAMTLWGVNLVNQYYYRKEFGLTYQEYLDEPVDIYTANTTIMSIRNELEEAERRRAKRKSQ